jgi:hypothetical protein
MSTWVPAITAGSLDGFVVGALVTGACFLAVLALWHVRQRDFEADDSVQPRVEVVGLADLVPVADPVAEDPVVPAGETAPLNPLPLDPLPLDPLPAALTAGGPGSDKYDAAAKEHLAAASHGEDQEAAVRDHLAALGAARRWQQAAAARRDEQVAGAAAARRDEQVAGAGRAGWPAERPGALPAGPPRPREPSALDGYGPAPTGALPDKPAQGGRHGRPGGGGHRAPHPLGDPTFGDTAGMPLPPGARRPPRHAAPAPSLGDKVTGLFATRSVADGHG